MSEGAATYDRRTQPATRSSSRSGPIDFLFATQDASTSSLCWAVSALESHPEVLARVRAEVAAVWSPDSGEPITAEKIQGMRYTQAVAREGALCPGARQQQGDACWIEIAAGSYHIGGGRQAGVPGGCLGGELGGGVGVLLNVIGDIKKCSVVALRWIDCKVQIISEEELKGMKQGSGRQVEGEEEVRC
ncbi:hypothetical protein QYE76_051190 [Lolium multiflorum]|uniref:Cytochrome P450 n=1 Tax=Lolium multiflorum TaxID=4521 RepID=A0AAD8SRF2_LOLMU|nr:hypothetical protein QYE76_051190 [Lolium multiflorum]